MPHTFESKVEVNLPAFEKGNEDIEVAATLRNLQDHLLEDTEFRNALAKRNPSNELMSVFKGLESNNLEVRELVGVLKLSGDIIPVVGFIWGIPGKGRSRTIALSGDGFIVADVIAYLWDKDSARYFVQTKELTGIRKFFPHMNKLDAEKITSYFSHDDALDFVANLKTALEARITYCSQQIASAGSVGSEVKSVGRMERLQPGRKISHSLEPQPAGTQILLD